MPNPGDLVPYGDDALVRRQDDTNRKLREGLAARSLERSQIGSGGLMKIAGSLEITGSLTVPGQLNSAGGITATAGNVSAPNGSVSAGLGITAGGDISTPATVSGGALNSSGDVTAGGRGVFPAGVRSIGVVSNTVVTAFQNMYTDGVGNFGVRPSSVHVKRDITPADTTDDVAGILRFALVDYRYIAAVELMGDDAPIERGGIAQYVESIGLGRWVSRDEEGNVVGINYESLTIPLIATVQNLDARLRALEARD